MGDMDVFYGPQTVETDDGELVRWSGMPTGSPWPQGIALPERREESYAALTTYVRLSAGDPKFVMHRKHLHAFGCPADPKTPLVVREVSTYSHEPTEHAASTPAPLPGWAGVHDNDFVAPQANSGRLVTKIQ